MENWTVENWLSLSLVLVTAATLIAIIYYVRSTNAMAQKTGAMAEATQDMVSIEKQRDADRIVPKLAVSVTTIPETPESPRPDTLRSRTRLVEMPLLVNVGEGYALNITTSPLDNQGRTDFSLGSSTTEQVAVLGPGQSQALHGLSHYFGGRATSTFEWETLKAKYQDIHMQWYTVELYRTEPGKLFWAGPNDEEPVFEDKRNSGALKSQE